MSVNLEDWQAHVTKDKSDPLRVSWCGVATSGTFALTDAEHAKGCVEQETWVQPCPACWAAIQEADE